MVTRGGQKAYVCTDLRRYNADDVNKQLLYPLRGFIVDSRITGEWLQDGRFHLDDDNNQFDLVGFWREKHTATVIIPCPLKEPRKDMWFISKDGKIVKSEGLPDYNVEFLKYGHYFGSEEEAKQFREIIISIRKG